MGFIRKKKFIIILWMGFIRKNDRHKNFMDDAQQDLPLAWTGDKTLRVAFTKVYTKVGFKPW
jgi:hypothetical protein